MVWRTAFVFCVGCLLAATSLAQVTPATSPLVDTRAHSYLDSLTKRLGFENTKLPKGHAVVGVSINGCDFAVLVVGPVSGDAKRYAEVLDRWRGTQKLAAKVAWSQEDDASAAVLKYRGGKFGLDHATTRIDLSSLRAAAFTVEPNVQIAVNAPRWADVQLDGASDAVSGKGMRYWNLGNRPELREAVGSLTAQRWVPGLMATWFLLMPIGVLACFALGIGVAKRESIPIAKRRKAYSQIVLGGTYGLIGVHSCLFLATMIGNTFDPTAQLWFGQTFARLALPIVPLFVIIPLLGLPLTKRYETKLFGPTELEAKSQRPLSPALKFSNTTVKRKMWLLVTYVLFILAFAVAFVIAMVGSFARGTLPSWIEIAALPLILIFSFLLQKAMPEFTLDKPDDERLAGVLRERTVSIASRMGIEPPASRLLLNPFLGSYGAIIDKKGLGVAANAVDVMSHDELSFLVAHELAHLKLGHLVVRKGWLIASVGLPLVGFALAVTAAFLTNTSRLVLPCAFAIIMLSRLVLHPLRVRVIRQQEFQADALAIQITGDPSTAARTLKLITLTSSNPTVSARIAAIKKDYPGAIYDA